MHSAAVVAAFAGLAAAQWGPGSQEHGQPGAWGDDSWTTEVVTAWTTYCPKATEVTWGSNTYTATEATTLVITDCPGGCTVSYPTTWATTAPTTWATTSSTSSAVTSPVTTETPTTWATTAVPPTTAPPAPYPIANTTTWATTPSTVASTASSYPSSPVPATGGAAQLSAGVGLIAAVFGLVAAL